MSGIFISYRRDDSRGSAGRLYDDLIDRFGSDRVFRDLDDIQPGADYREMIARLIESCDAVLVVIGNQWLDVRDASGQRRLDDPEDLVRQELSAALQASKTVIPVLVEDAVLPGASQLPTQIEALTHRNALPLSDLRWKYDVNVLAERLEGLVGASPPRSGSASATAPPRPSVPAAHVGKGRVWRLRSWQGAVAAAMALALVAVVTAAVASGGKREPSIPTPRGPAQFGRPAGVALDAGGSLYVADAQEDVVKRIKPDGTITTVAGTGETGSAGDGGPATSATLDTPGALAVDGSGNLYIAEDASEGHGGIRKVSPDGIITSVQVRSPGVARLLVRAMVAAPDNSLVVATDREVLRIIPDGSLVAVTGSASTGYAGDGGPATSAKLDDVRGLAVAGDGDIYIADAGNNRVRKVADGKITTVAGTGSPKASGDGGPAVEAGVTTPVAVATGEDGSVFIATSDQVRRVAAGTISLFAGDPEDSSGLSGDGGPASSARLSEPVALSVDRNGDLYLSDSGNHRVRKISRGGIITTVA
ncbi:MAG: TIR domain-containing protein [Acidimicrobiales bacterium]